jgi:hypothetical protein
MVDTSQIIQDIEVHNDLCHRLLDVIQQENQWLSQDHPSGAPAPPDQAAKRSLLDQLSQQVSLIQGHRVALKDHEQTNPENPIPEAIHAAIGRGTDLIMKMVALDRENEKLLLKKGMVPSNQIPSSAQYRPSDALKTYQKHSS